MVSVGLRGHVDDLDALLLATSQPDCGSASYLAATNRRVQEPSGASI